MRILHSQYANAILELGKPQKIRKLYLQASQWVWKKSFLKRLIFKVKKCLSVTGLNHSNVSTDSKVLLFTEIGKKKVFVSIKGFKRFPGRPKFEMPADASTCMPLCNSRHSLYSIFFRDIQVAINIFPYTKELTTLCHAINKFVFKISDALAN